MFQFSALPSRKLCIHLRITASSSWVSPFGDLGINAYLLLPLEYRR